MSDTQAPTAWRTRIVGHGAEEPTQLLANPKNWRIHPRHQQKALSSVLDQIGWVQDVIVSREELEVPVSYVELTDAEEDLVLAGLDPLSGMAETNTDALDALMHSDVQSEIEALFAPEDNDQHFADDSGYRPQFGADDPFGVGDSGGLGDDDEPPGRSYVVMCPECGEEFTVAVPD
jgi:hypothetical protein